MAPRCTGNHLLEVDATRFHGAESVRRAFPFFVASKTASLLPFPRSPCDQSKNNRKMSSKHVSFANSGPEVIFIPNRVCYADAELHEMHYTTKDYCRIASENELTLQYMRLDRWPNGKMLYFRGLECELPDNKKKRRCARATSCAAVLHQQAKSKKGRYTQTYVYINDRCRKSAYDAACWDVRQCNVASKD
jgi:hypothetical protein